MILKKVEGRRNPRAWHGSRLTVSGLHGHPSTPNPRPKRRVETPGDPWGVPQPPGPSSPAYGTPPTANRWFLPLSSSQWGQTLPTTSVMFPVRIEPRGHAQGGKKIPGKYLVESDINFTEMLTSNVQLGCVLTRGGGQAVQGWFTLPPPPPRISERMDNPQILLHHLLQEYLVERDINFTETLTSNVQLGCVLTRGVGG